MQNLSIYVNHGFGEKFNFLSCLYHICMFNVHIEEESIQVYMNIVFFANFF